MVKGSDRLRRALERRQQKLVEPPGPPASPEAPGAVLRRRFGKPGFAPREPRPVVALPTGCELANDRGACFAVVRRYGLDERHGDHALGCGLAVDGPRLAEVGRDPALEGFDPERALFLDTETTGLHGGAGNTVFMVGLGFYDGGELVVEQVFLRDFGEEPAALQHVADRVGRYPHLVTFVGKSFDRHRLAARMAVQKVRSPMLNAPHLDLYYAARRSYKDELPNCRLRTIEEQRLGVFRRDDLPGAEAPAAFLQWLRDGTGPVDRVFEHNHLDVLSLVTLLGVLGREPQRPPPARG